MTNTIGCLILSRTDGRHRLIISIRVFFDRTCRLNDYWGIRECNFRNISTNGYRPKRTGINEWRNSSDIAATYDCDGVYLHEFNAWNRSYQIRITVWSHFRRPRNIVNIRWTAIEASHPISRNMTWISVLSSKHYDPCSSLRERNDTRQLWTYRIDHTYEGMKTMIIKILSLRDRFYIR